MSLLGADGARRAARAVPHRGRRRSWRSPTGACTAGSRCRESRLDGDRIVCGYHGFTYDADGGCVSVPGQQRIPRTARVAPTRSSSRTPSCGSGSATPGSPTRRAIPRAPWLADPAGRPSAAWSRWRRAYGLLVDNLMDLSHETYLHGGYIGTPEVAETPITTEVDEEAGIVRVSRHMDDAECPPFYARSTGIEGRITRWQDIEYHAPCLYLLHSRIAPVGVRPPARRQRPATPSTSRSSTRSPRRPSTPRTTSGPSPATSPSTTRRSPTFLRENNRTVVLQDVDGARTCWSRSSPPSPTATRS